MPPQLRRLLDSGRALLDGFTTGQKTVLGVAVVGVLLAGILFMSWASQPSLAALYTDLDASDAAAITEQLDGRGTTYELADGGRTVLVPRKDLYRLRLDMSAAGLPEGGAQGYALLDKQGITASEFRQRVDYQRALEGELTRTISTIDGVAAAKVHLVIPEDDLFRDEVNQPTASVLLKTRAGNDLTSGQVQSIVHLVSSSVEGLAADQVTVADDKGTMLAAAGEEGTSAAANDARSQQTRDFEQNLARSVQQLLEPVTGSGGAVVRVRADLDFDQRSTHIERYEPVADLPPAAETTSRETYTGVSAPVGGVLGPDGQPVVPDGGDNTYEREEAQISRALTTVTEEVKTAPGQVRRMSVAVLLDGNGGPVNEGAVANLVSAATLLDPERGDDLQITTMAFDTTASEDAAAELAAAEAAEQRAELMELIRNVAVLAVVALALFLAYRSARKPRRQAIAVPEPYALGDGEEILDLDFDHEPTAVGPARPALEPAAVRRLELQSEVAELVERQPEEVAQLLRSWLADRRAV